MYAPKSNRNAPTFISQNKTGKGLSEKVVKGSFWVFLSRIISQVFTIARLIILARILAPPDFGLMGIALLVMLTLETFFQTGFQQALVQKEKNVEKYLNTVWTVLILRGLILFVILYFIAPYAAIFFAQPTAKTIVQVIGLSILLKAFTNIGTVFFQKELEFKKQFIYEVSGTLTDFLVAISSVLILKNVWALAFGFLAGNLVTCIVSYIIHPYRPVPDLDLKKIAELFSYGRWILGSSVLIFVGAYIDDIFVGKLLGATALGFYQMAYRISNIPASEITYVTGKVAFPAYSKIQCEQSRLQQGYFQIMRLTAALSIPIAAATVLLAEDFTIIFLGEKWLPMVPAMQLLAIAGLIKSIISTGSPLFAGSGHPNFEFYTQLTRAFVMMISIYPITVNVGISGAAVCVILSMAGMLLVWYRFSRNITEASRQKYTDAIWPPLFSSLVMAGSICLFSWYFNSGREPVAIGISVFLAVTIIGFFTYLAVLYSVQKFYPKFGLVDDARVVYHSIVGR